MAAFIFDVDGTIIDSMPWHGRSWEVFLTRHGVKYEGEAFLRRTAGRTGMELMKEIFVPLDDAAGRALVEEKEALYRELFRPVFREIPGFREFARQARALGIRLACATAGDATNIAFALDGLDMAQGFDAATCADDVARGKPEPDLFLLAAERMRVEPRECIVFEDARAGIEAARRAGMKAVAITSGDTQETLAGIHVLKAMPDYRGIRPQDVLSLAAGMPVAAG